MKGCAVELKVSDSQIVHGPEDLVGLRWCKRSV